MLRPVRCVCLAAPTVPDSSHLLLRTADWHEFTHATEKFTLSVRLSHPLARIIAERQLYLHISIRPLHVLMQLCWASSRLVWPAVARSGPALLIGLFSLQLAAQKLPVASGTSEPLRRERSASMNCMCAQCGRQDWITDCFVWDRETLCGKMSREMGGGYCLREVRHRNRRTETDIPTNVLHVAGKIWGWEGERREEEIGYEACWWAVCVWGQLGDLKDTTVQDWIHDYYWFRTRLGADSSAACSSRLYCLGSNENAVTSLDGGEQALHLRHQRCGGERIKTILQVCYRPTFITVCCMALFALSRRRNAALINLFSDSFYVPL